MINALALVVAGYRKKKGGQTCPPPFVADRDWQPMLRLPPLRRAPLWPDDLAGYQLCGAICLGPKINVASNRGTLPDFGDLFMEPHQVFGIAKRLVRDLRLPVPVDRRDDILDIGLYVIQKSGVIFFLVSNSTFHIF